MKQFHFHAIVWGMGLALRMSAIFFLALVAANFVNWLIRRLS